MAPCAPDALKDGGVWTKQEAVTPFCTALQPPLGPVPLIEDVVPVIVIVAIMDTCGSALIVHPDMTQFKGETVSLNVRLLTPLPTKLRLPVRLAETDKYPPAHSLASVPLT